MNMDMERVRNGNKDSGSTGTRTLTGAGAGLFRRIILGKSKLSADYPAESFSLRWKVKRVITASKANCRQKFNNL
jgi:hypothetical protein